VDAIETFNACCWPSRFNRRAAAYACQRQLLSMVGSDAHTTGEPGTATLRLPPSRTLKAALAHAQPDVRQAMPWVRLFSK
jgi:predicted metal-dependent phosphoesterase TrpH